MIIMTMTVVTIIVVIVLTMASITIMMKRMVRMTMGSWMMFLERIGPA